MPRTRLSPEMSKKLDAMIASGNYSAEEMSRATGAKIHNVNKRKQRRLSLTIKRHPRQTRTIIVNQPGQIQRQNNCLIDVQAELNNILLKQQEMELALKRDGPDAAPALLMIMGEQRKTIETLLKARVVLANLPGSGEDIDIEQELNEVWKELCPRCKQLFVTGLRQKPQ